MYNEQPVNILLVDDRSENRLALAAILEPLGQNLVQAASGQEALKCLLRQDFAVILLDVQMPGMDGFETAELIRGRERSRHTPIIFLTAINTSEMHISHGYALGAVDYLLKPIVPEILLSKVSVFADLYRKTTQIERQAAELRGARDELEQRVRERTAGLAAANQALQFLAQASSVLAESLEYEDRLGKIARLALPILGDCCAIDIAEETGAVRRVASAALDPAKEQLAQELQARYPYDPEAPHGLARVLRSGQAEICVEVPEGTLQAYARDKQHLALLRAFGPASYMCVPLQARDRTLGVLSVATCSPERRYGQPDLRLAQDLARRIALAIDNARLYWAAQESIRIREIFLSVAAHELRTPLTTLLGYTQLLERRAQREQSLPERDQEALGIVNTYALRLNKMIASLLDISRLQLGQLSIEAQPLDLGQFASRMVDETRPLLAEHTIVYHGPSEPVQINGDELRLEQAVQNLIQNAIKYSPGGGTIEVRVEHNGAHAAISVVDPGIGIPAEALPQLFDRFYRAPNADSKHISGLGVGLYVVKEIVELHGGTVEVRSEEGAGSTFTLAMPLLVQAEILAD